MGSVHEFLHFLKNNGRARFLFIAAATLFYTLLLTNTSALVARNFKPKPNEISNPIAAVPQVKGVATDVSPTPTSTPRPEPTATPQPTKKPTPKPAKTTYKIAIFGDSMVDTMGETLEYLESSMREKNPGFTFALYNYGQGSINVEQGIEKFNQQFSYSSRLFAPLPQIQADIVIIGSFAYNPFEPYNRDRHWIGLTKLVEEAEKTSAKVYLLAEIAPLRRDFGKGPNGVNWDSDTAYNHSGHIIEQLENAVALSKILNVPLINVFEKTYNKDKKEGARQFVNFSDGIHPSQEGHKVTADLISDALKLN